LKTLHEEFTHHQDKIDQYHSVLGDIEKGNIASMIDKLKPTKILIEHLTADSLDEEEDGFNDLEPIEEKEKKYRSQANKLK
jgi:Alpha-2-macroglobulin RAP, C-terminal domain